MNNDYLALDMDYDAEYDTLYLKSKKDYEYNVSIEANQNLVIDISKNGEVFAFEILDATYFFDLKNTELFHANYEVNVIVTEDIIKLHFEVITSGAVQNRAIKLVSSKALNTGQAVTGLYTYKYTQRRLNR